MSQQEFDAYLRLLGRFLRLSDAQREAIASELQDHMEERLAELLEQGYTREDAIQTALGEFGDAAALAADFGRVGRRRRWIMRTTAATVGLAATILIVSFLLPENRAYLPAPSLSQADQRTLVGARSSGAAATMPGYAGGQVGSATPLMIAGAELKAEREVLQRLGKALPDVHFAEGTGFQEVIEFLRQAAGVSIDVNWNALQLVGVDKTTDTQGVNLRNVRVDRVIQLLLENVSGRVGERLGYSVVDGFVRISSTEDLDRHLVVRVYDCQDLIRRPLTEEQKARLQARGAAPGFGMPGGMGGGGGGAAFPAPADVMAMLEAQESQRLTQLLRETIAPGTWAPESQRGSVSEYDGLLIVRNTWNVQQSVAEFLSLLRQARAARNESPAAQTAVSLADGVGLFSHAAAEQVLPEARRQAAVRDDRSPTTKPATE
jgi:hypothetical protein